VESCNLNDLLEGGRGGGALQTLLRKKTVRIRGPAKKDHYRCTTYTAVGAVGNRILSLLVRKR